MLTIDVARTYGGEEAVYNPLMAKFGIGDVIRITRKKRRWNQERLGDEAKKFVIHPGQGPINKSTVSKVETDPYTSEFITVWRVAAAAGLTLADLIAEVGTPFLPAADAAAAELIRIAEKEIRAKARTSAKRRSKR